MRETSLRRCEECLTQAPVRLFSLILRVCDYLVVIVVATLSVRIGQPLVARRNHTVWRSRREELVGQSLQPTLLV